MDIRNEKRGKHRTEIKRRRSSNNPLTKHHILYCNKAGCEVKIDHYYYLTSCRHIFCIECRENKNPRNECILCGKRCRYEGRRIREKMDDLFMLSTHNINNIIKESIIFHKAEDMITIERMRRTSWEIRAKYDKVSKELEKVQREICMLHERSGSANRKLSRLQERKEGLKENIEDMRRSRGRQQVHKKYKEKDQRDGYIPNKENMRYSNYNIDEDVNERKRSRRRDKRSEGMSHHNRSQHSNSKYNGQHNIENNIQQHNIQQHNIQQHNTEHNITKERVLHPIPNHYPNNYENIDKRYNMRNIEHGKYSPVPERRGGGNDGNRASGFYARFGRDPTPIPTVSPDPNSFITPPPKRSYY